ncbi:ATP-binding protein [Streptomyces ovatisporus]|uniref:histidine kinase n=1 Tax=Streptomyces ovatisporus TaxID=1128682 RepID=A0ABV9AEH7_9ACTN
MSGPASSQGSHPGKAPLPVASPESQGVAAQGSPGAPAAGVNGSRRRHGRAPARQNPSDAAFRRHLVRLAVLPAGVVAVAGAAVVAYVMSVEGGVDASGAPAPDAEGTAVWSVLAGTLLLVCGVVVGAAYAATSQARRVLERHTALRRSVARGRSEIRSLLLCLEQGDRPRLRPHPALPEPDERADAVEWLAHELELAQHSAESAVAEAAAVVRSNSSGNEEKVEVFVNLARRLQSLVHREIELLDDLENQVEDPDLLKGLFHVDHLATRIRRHAENLAVLGGAVSRRQWSRPVTMTEVLRSAIAEVEHYPRVKLVPPIEGTLRGHAVADVIHLLAELVENATVFSAPHTQVLLRAQHVTAGLAIEVEDRGLGMTASEQSRMNAVLSDPERIDVGELLRDGRIGLFVVSALAQRHGIVVQLQSNIYGGIQAVLVLPREVLGEESGSVAQQNGNVTGAAVRTPNSAAAGGGSASVGAAAAPSGPYGPAEAGSSDTTELPRVRTGTPEHARVPAPEQGGGVPPQGAAGQNGPQSRTRRESQPLPQHQPARPQHPSPSAGRSVPPAPSAQPGPQPPLQTPAPAPGPGPSRGASNGERPELPRRRRQEHLVPELREAPAARHDGGAAAEWDERAQGHDPGLMAAFRRGMSLAEDAGGDDVPRPAG